MTLTDLATALAESRKICVVSANRLSTLVFDLVGQ